MQPLDDDELTALLSIPLARTTQATPGSYRMVVSSSTGDGMANGSALLLNYESSDLLTWNFTSVLYKDDTGCSPRAECANYFELDGVMVLIISCPSSGESPRPRFFEPRRSRQVLVVLRTFRACLGVHVACK